jgi:hypothetical protein
MIDPVDPAKREPNDDWRTEIHWPRVRRLILLHALYWTFGAAQAVLYQAGILVGTTRTLAGIVDYATWGVLAVLGMRIVARTRCSRGSAHRVSPPTFLILVGFMASLGAYIVLLSLIDMGTILLL